MTAPARDPIASEARRAKRERLLGDSPACVRCGLAEIDSLIAVKRGVLEAHHVVGRANDEDLTVALCRNCHAVVTERYRDAGVSLNRPPTVLHQLAAILRALRLHSTSQSVHARGARNRAGRVTCSCSIPKPRRTRASRSRSAVTGSRAGNRGARSCSLRRDSFTRTTSRPRSRTHCVNWTRTRQRAA